MDAGELDATKRIGAMAKKAQELMLHQKEIEKRVSERWGDVSAAGTSWAGQYLPTVEVSHPVTHCSVIRSVFQSSASRMRG